MFASQAAATLQQFNRDTFWGTLAQELYCHISMAQQLLPPHMATLLNMMIKGFQQMKPTQTPQ